MRGAGCQACRAESRLGFALHLSEKAATSTRKNTVAPGANERAGLRWKSMLASKQVEFNINGMFAETIGESADIVGRKVFVLRSRDVQDRRDDRLVLVFLPILGNAPADPDHASGFLRMRADKTIVQSHRLRESHQHRAARIHSKALAKMRRDRPDHLVMQLDIQIGVAPRAPVVGHLFTGGSSRRRRAPGRGRTSQCIGLVGGAQARDNTVLAYRRNAKPKHYLGIRAVAMQCQNQQRPVTNCRRHVQVIGDIQIYANSFQTPIIKRPEVPIKDLGDIFDEFALQ